MLLPKKWDNAAGVSSEALLSYGALNGSRGDVWEILLAEECSVVDLARFELAHSKLAVSCGQFRLSTGLWIVWVETTGACACGVETADSAG